MRVVLRENNLVIVDIDSNEKMAADDILTTAEEKVQAGEGSFGVPSYELFEAEGQVFPKDYGLAEVPLDALLDELQKRYKQVRNQSRPVISVPTTAGTLKAFVAPDPGQPGIVTMLQPAGKDDDIDLAFVSVYEDKNYQTIEKEQPEDVVIMSYADPFTENYTSKDIIRGDILKEALR